MGRKKRRGKNATAFVAALGAAIAAFPAFAGTTLVVGKSAATNPSMMAVDVGDQVGFFKKHGLDLKIVNFGGSARMIQALTAGSLDIGIADGTAMAFVTKGVPMLAVCESTTTLPFSVGVPWGFAAQIARGAERQEDRHFESRHAHRLARAGACSQGGLGARRGHTRLHRQRRHGLVSRLPRASDRRLYRRHVLFPGRCREQSRPRARAGFRFCR